ncbi:MAG TPA: hypothetical protein VMZ92_08550, partial [Planctomycetota bacterium]|nr:hypothetical protein [Planctomycetota bacterium]
MAVAYDAGSTSGYESNPSWTHTPSGTPRGVVVWTVSASGDNCSNVTYGGVSMTEVTGSPNNKSSGEGIRVQCFFLGSGLGTGAKTVSV